MIPVWLSIIALGKVSFVALNSATVRTAHSAHHRIFALPLDAGQLRRELASAWHIVLLDLAFALAFLRLGLLSPSGTVGQSLLVFLILYFWADFSFYVLHRAMHHSRWLWRIHRFHHEFTVVQPSTTIALSLLEHLVEETLPWFLALLVLGRFMTVPLPGVALFYAYFGFSSSAAHSNVEMVAGWASRIPGLGAVLNTPTAHALHHMVPKKNYGLFTKIWDRLFSSAYPATAELERRAVAGQPVTSRSELRA